MKISCKLQEINLPNQKLLFRLRQHIGNKWKQRLIEDGVLRPERIKVGRTFRVLLRPTDYARLLLDSYPGGDPQASYAHEYWKRKVAEDYIAQGYEVTIEHPRKKSSGCMDLFVVKGNEQLAIEIETGKSNVISNVKRDLLEGRCVVVVPTSELALKKIETELAKTGLILLRRVRLRRIQNSFVE